MRTDTDAVTALLEEYNTDIDLDQCIETANMMVTDNCTESDYSDAKLELIERYLSAHFYEIISARRKFAAAGKVQQSTESKVDLGLDLTRYGQTAKIIDNAGNLAALDNALKTVKKGLAVGIQAKILWLGTED